MGNEQVGHVPLQLQQQFQHLRLYGHVKRAHGLVEYDETGLGRYGSRDAHPLELPPAQLVGITVPQRLREPRLSSSGIAHDASSRKISNGSLMSSSTVNLGLAEDV